MDSSAVPSAMSRADRLRQRSAARREAQRGRLRELLLEVAEEQLLARGYSAFSLREVAEATEYTPTTIYRYFRDRDALIEAVLQKWFRAFALTLGAADEPGAEPRGRLLSMADAYLRFALDEPARYRVMFMERADIGVLPGEGSHLADDPAFGLLLRASAALVADGDAAARASVQLAMMLWLGLHGVAAMAVASAILDVADAHRLGMALARTVLQGVHAASE